MWISKAKWDEMEARLKKLEVGRVGVPAEPECFTVYQRIGDFYCWNSIKKAKIPVKEVVQRILDRLGMELTYVAGKPEKVEMQKKAKK